MPLLSLAVAAVLLQQNQVLWMEADLPMSAKSDTALMFRGPVSPLETPKLSPKRFGENKIQWEFDWMLEGYSKSTGTPFHRDFLVFSQEHKTVGDKAPQVMRMLLRLHDLNLKRIGVGHNPDYDSGTVDVFLCFGGKAGGEQLYDVDQGIEVSTKRPVEIKVDTIYIYDMSSFTDPVEMAREVAHEYGHATLPAIGGYKAPEDWANGYLGERLSLRWLRDELVKGELTPDDMMGADKAGLDKWLSVNVDPLVDRAAQTEPTEAVMSDKSAAGMNAYLGLALYVDGMFSDAVFARSIKMTGSYDAKDYPDAAILAAEEPEQITLKIPASLVGKLIWVPVGTGKLSGAPIVQKDKAGWVQIKAVSTPVEITNRR